LGSKAAEEAFFCSYPVSDTDVGIDRLEGSSLLSLIGFERGPAVIYLSEDFYFVLAFFLVILGSKAAEEAVFSFHLVVGDGTSNL
jgi:hypothetical protein